MRFVFGLILCCVSLGQLMGPPAHARQSAGADVSLWTGAKSCGACHEEIFKTWSRGPHAAAAKSLGERSGDGRCESCHGTGDAPAGRQLLKNVQCEACHGAGRHYSSADIMRDPTLAHAMGLRDLGTKAERNALCMRCHVESTSILPFDVDKAWLVIAH
jgi:hypothetical protein